MRSTAFFKLFSTQLYYEPLNSPLSTVSLCTLLLYYLPHHTCHTNPQLTSPPPCQLHTFPAPPSMTYLSTPGLAIHPLIHDLPSHLLHPLLTYTPPHPWLPFTSPLSTVQLCTLSSNVHPLTNNAALLPSYIPGDPLPILSTQCSPSAPSPHSISE